MAKAISTVEVIGKGSVKATGQAVYGVTSSSEPGHVHLVTWSPTAHQWECDCAAYAFRRRCAHLRELSARLAVELRRRDAEVAAANIGPDDTFAITPAGRAALAEWRTRKEAEEQRNTAPRRGPRAFSVLKQ